METGNMNLQLDNPPQDIKVLSFKLGTTVGVAINVNGEVKSFADYRMDPVNPGKANIREKLHTFTHKFVEITSLHSDATAVSFDINSDEPKALILGQAGIVEGLTNIHIELIRASGDGLEKFKKRNVKLELPVKEEGSFTETELDAIYLSHLALSFISD